MTMSPICVYVEVRPRPWTRTISPARRMLPPPTLQVVLWTACDDLVEGQAVLDQPVGVDADLVLLLEAAPAIDFRRARTVRSCG